MKTISFSKLEPVIIERICRPVLMLIPEWVHPNVISVTNHLLVWLMFLSAAIAPSLSPAGALAARVTTGVLVFLVMLLDCLDGMQARRTGQASKLGEVLDHWLDAIHVALISGAILLTLEIDPWLLVIVHILSCMIYNAQVVLYHHTDEFVHPSTSGTDVLFGWSFGYVALGVILYLFPRSGWMMDLMVTALCGVAVVTSARICWFYYKRMGRHVLHHLPFVGVCAAFGAIYLAGAMSTWAFILVICGVSFVISGSYVISTVVGRKYGGTDWGLLACILLIPFVDHFVVPVSYQGYTLQSAAPYLACLYMIGRNLVDFVRAYPLLNPGNETSPF